MSTQARGTRMLAGKLAAGLVLAAAITPIDSAMASEGDGLDWRVTPMYLWLPSVKTDLRTDQPPVPNTSSFSAGLN